MLIPNLALAETKWITVWESITSHTERALQVQPLKVKFSNMSHFAITQGTDIN
jgi:hypothetical protein